MQDIAIASNFRHQERIHVNLHEQRRNFGDDRRNVEVLRLAYLTFVTCADKPANVVIQVWPPETKEEGLSRCIDAFVSELLMDIVDETETLSFLRDKLGSMVLITAEELNATQIVVQHLADEVAILLIAHVVRSLQRCQETPNHSESFITQHCFGGTGNLVVVQASVSGGEGGEGMANVRIMPSLPSFSSISPIYCKNLLS